ncbi:hypothetical protein VTO42DRAFT_8322 [Malbranchea cinnamomea]
MPGNLRRKILKNLGLTRLKREASSDSNLSGTGVVNHDERSLCKQSTHNGTYPRLTRLSDGAILASFTRWEGDMRILCITRSTDEGKSFVEIGEVTRRRSDTDNLFLIEVAPAVVLAAFRNHDLGPGPDGFTHFRITVCKSVDGGRTWTYLSQAAEKSPPFGIWEPFMRIGKEGELQLIFSQEFAYDDQRTMMVVSRDQGRTWTKPICIEGWKEKLRDGMTGIAATKDNGRDALVMVFETTRHGPFSIEAVVSYDDGKTWRHRDEVYVPKPGRNAGAPQIASYADGSMVVVFMTDEDAEKVEWTRNASIKAVFAGPLRNGKTHWSKATLVSPPSSFWPGIMALDGYTALATYEHHGPRGKTITWCPK